MSGTFASPAKDVNQMSNGEMAVYGNDRNLMVKFERRKVNKTFASESAGHPIYEDRDYVVITTPGAKSNLEREVKLVSDERGPSDPERFPQAWRAFQNKTKEVHDGTPIENWAMLGHAPSIIYALKAGEIHTVEMLAGLADNAFGSVPVMDIRKWRDRAKAFVDQAKGNAPLAGLAKKNEQLEQELELLKKQMAEIVEAKANKRGPGRPPKEIEDDAS